MVGTRDENESNMTLFGFVFTLVDQSHQNQNQYKTKYVTSSTSSSSRVVRKFKSGSKFHGGLEFVGESERNCREKQKRQMRFQLNMVLRNSTEEEEGQAQYKFTKNDKKNRKDGNGMKSSSSLPLSANVSHANGSEVKAQSSSSAMNGKEMRSSNQTGGSAVVDGVGQNSKAVAPWDGPVMNRISYLQRRFQFVQRRERMLSKAYDECERITSLYAKTFALGTSFLSAEKRTAVRAIYVWCRRTDDLVDGPRVEQRCESLRFVLEEWERRLEEIFDGKARDALDLALVDTVARFPSMDIEPFRDMIAGMLMDVEKDRYDTFDELYLYCYRVAGTVGLMTLPVMGSYDGSMEMLARAREPALSLGVALQLTNILRDVGEDRLRGRIYLPREDLERFNYSEKDLMNCVLDSRYRELMKFQIARARMYFEKAEQGVELLHNDAKLPVRASMDMYRKILDVIEDNGYDNFNKRAYVSKNEKLRMLPMSYILSRPKDSLISQLAARFRV